MGIGKTFEKEFKESVPNHCFYLRLKDGTAAYDKSSKVRYASEKKKDVL